MATKSIKLIITFLFIAAPICVTDSLAAGMGMGMGMGTGPCGGPFPPCPVPLDSGVMLLLCAGALYGGFKIYSSLKKNPA
jgi:hypothetical protein